MVARIPWVERGVGHDRLVIWHPKLGPWSLYLIGFHVLFIALSSAGQDGVMSAVEMWRMLNGMAWHGMAWMWPAMAEFLLMILAGVTSYKKARANMSYETLWIIHVRSYVAIAASFIHPQLYGQVPCISDSDIYICDLEPLVNVIRNVADNLGVPKNRFHDKTSAFHP